jgi:hypothetical protein
VLSIGGLGTGMKASKVRLGLVAALAGAGFGLQVRTAHADPTFHVAGTFGVAYSDNVLGAPDVPPPGAPIGPPVADVGIHFAPGAALLHDGRRGRWALTYAHPMLLYVRHPLAHSSGDLANFLGMFALSPYDDLDVRVTLARMSSSIAGLNVPIGEREIGAVRTGNTTMVTLAAQHLYTHAFSPSWSAVAGGTAAVSTGIDGSGSMFAGTWNAGPRFTRERHMLGLAGTLMYARPLVADPLNAGYFSEQALVVGGEARWGWDWTERWSSQLSGGAVAPVVGRDIAKVRPVGSATIRYDNPWGYSMSLGWARGYVPSVVTGQTYFTDSLSLRGTLALWREGHLLATTTTGFAWSRVIDFARGIDTDVVKTGTVNAAIGWYPDALPHVILSYSFTKQFDAPENQILLPNFHRNIVGISLEYMWPPRVLPMSTSGARRVDGSDRPKTGP